MMIAHGFAEESFGPAQQRLHGASVHRRCRRFGAAALDASGVVLIDIT
jgi:hypothetical protein